MQLVDSFLPNYRGELITLGNYLTDNCANNDELVAKASDFIDFHQLDASRLHQFNKLCRFNEPTAQLAVLQWLLERPEEVGEKRPLQFRSDGAQCTVTIYTKWVSKAPFYVADFKGWADLFVTIDGLESIKPGAGKQLLEAVSSVDVPVLIQVGFLYYGDYELEREGVNTNTLERLVPFYESAGFVNVNDFIGQYEEAVIMMKADPDLVQRIKNNTLKWSEK